MWQKFSDRARENRKVRAVSDRAFRLWWAIGNWCAEHETDGYIPKKEVKDTHRPLGTVKRFRYAEALAELVEKGLLEDHETAYKVHDFDAYNPTKAELIERRRGQNVRASRHRARQKDEEFQAPDAEVTRSITAVTERVGNGPRPVPSRPEEEQRDHATRALSAARANVIQASPREALPREGEFTPDQMWLVFARRWTEVIGTYPSQGGSNLGELATMVRETAAAQHTDPRLLFEQALEKYLARQHDKVELRSPYACFAKAWGELTVQRSGVFKRLPDGLTLEEYRERTRSEVAASQPRRVGGVRV